MHQAVKKHAMNMLKIRLRNDFPEKKMRFYIFAPKTKHKQITTLNCRHTKVHEHANILWLNAVRWYRIFMIGKHPKETRSVIFVVQYI